MKTKKYKCTYTSLRGAPCPVMCEGKYKEPHPKHCHAYDTSIWKINPKKTCEDCVPLEPGEVQKKKKWCDQMSYCDSYNDGGSDQCDTCFGGVVVFEVLK